MNNLLRDIVPNKRPESIVEWAQENVKLPGSVMSRRFDASLTPWIIEPLERLASVDTKSVTFCAPIQTGKSSIGEIFACWVASFGRGLLQFNWPSDPRASSRWKERILPALQACKSVRWTGRRFEELLCQAYLLNSTIKVQGVYDPKNLDADSAPYQINEEVHSWKPGFLAKADGRQTAVWNAIQCNISNAGNEGDQLDEKFSNGTSQEWTVKCPGCGLYHAMRTRWEDSHPELGGLRYDSDVAKKSSIQKYDYDYNKLAPTIRYQMPCGYIVRDTPLERRALSRSGKYSEPMNTGALLSARSYTLEAVSIDYIPWMLLIQEKHAALRALACSDDEPWRRYLTERECKPYSPRKRPYIGAVILDNTRKKSREGMPGRFVRFWAVDRQKGIGRKGQTPHYWLVVRDVDENANSLLVWEGMCQTDSDLLSRLSEHECDPQSGVVDATFDRTNMLTLCLRNGFQATTGSAQRELFYDKKTGKRSPWSVDEPIHKLLGVAPKCNYERVYSKEKKEIYYTPSSSEPRHWSYNKVGILKLLFFLKNHKAIATHNGSDDYISWDVPGDVSDEYKTHIESWQETVVPKGASRELVSQYQQLHEDDHMLMCEAYIAMLISMSGILSNRLKKLGVKEISNDEQ